MSIDPSVSLADKLSVFPVLQQVVGIGTALSNSLKIICDVALITFYTAKMNQKNPGKGTSIKQRLRPRIEKIKQDIASHNYKPSLIKPHILARLKAGISTETMPEISEADCTQLENLYVRQALLNRHIKYFGIGLLRATPIAGTIYGAVMWYRPNRFKKLKIET